MAKLIPYVPQFFESAADGSGAAFLVGGKLYSYLAGTTTPTPTYTNADDGIPNTNPVILDARGEAQVWIDPAVSYKFVLTDANDVQIWSIDNTGVDEGSQLAADLAAPSGSSHVGFIQAGGGAVARTAQSKMRDIVSVKDFGAVGDGVTDDSAAFAAAFASHSTVVAPFAVYVLKDISIGTNKSLIADGAVFKAATGASYIFKLTGFRPQIRGAYLDDALDHITHGVGTNAAVIVEDAAYPVVDQCWFVNVYAGLLLKVSVVDTSHETTKGQFSRLRFDTVTASPVYVGPNVNTATFYDMRMYVGTTPSGGLEKPRAGCTGFSIVSTGSALAFGGHMLRDIDIEQAEHGFRFVDAALSHISGCFADSLSGTGFSVEGACDKLHFSGNLAGTCLVGFAVNDTSTDIIIDDAETIYLGVVPPWGDPATFFNAGSPFGIAAFDTASVSVGSWYGTQTLFADPGATITFEASIGLHSASPSNIAAATTAYFGPVGNTAADVAQWVATKPGIIRALRAQSVSAPGAAQTYTYTVRINGADTALVATSSGAASFQATQTDYITFTEGQTISVKLVTSAGAAASVHRLGLTICYFS